MTLPIAPYGIRVIVASLLACFLLILGLSFVAGWLALVLLAPAGFVLFFFRDPERKPDDKAPNAILAPADGKVVGISQGKMPASDSPATVVDVFLSVFDVHINRAPVAGKVVETRYSKGQFLNALRSAAGDVNENNLIVIEASTGCNLAVRQIAGVIARRIVCAVSQGDSVAAGERLGMIMFGSRTQVYIPFAAGFEPKVSIGQRVKAGKTVLGYLR